MRRLMLWAHAHPVLSLVILALVTVSWAYQASSIKVSANFEAMMSDEPATRALYEESTDRFGSDKSVIVYVRDADLFTPDKLAALDAVVAELEDIPGVVRCDSLFSVLSFSSSPEGVQVERVMDWVPETPEEVREVRDRVVATPMLQGVVVSRDLKSTAVNLEFDPGQMPPGRYSELYDRIEAVIVEHGSPFQKIFQAGYPSFQAYVSKTVLRDQLFLIPLAGGVLFVALIITNGSLAAGILPLLTAGLSIVWTLGFMSLAGVPLNILTVMVPALLIVVGSTEDIHIINEFRSELATAGNRGEAVRGMAGKVGTASTLTALTTALGFAAICVNDIQILRQFGMAASFGMVANPLVTGLLLPVLLGAFGTAKKSSGIPARRTRIAEAMARFACSRHRVIHVVSFVAIIGIGAMGAFIKVNNDVQNTFKPGHPLEVQFEEVARHMSGVQNFSICLTTGREGEFRQPEQIALINDIQTFITETGKFGSSRSMADIVLAMHRVFGPGKGSLPASSREVAQYLLMLPGDDLRAVVTSDYSAARIMVRHSLNNSHDQKIALDELKAYIADRVGPYVQASITGQSILFLDGADEIAVGQVLSILLLMTTIFCIMSILFVNVKAGLLALFPNMFPVAVLFGTMYLFDVPLNIGTAMVACVAVGIAVDDTIHIMTRYNRAMKALGDQNLAIEQVMCAEFTSITATSLSLSLGFAVLTVSDFMPVVQFGYLSAVVMFAAMLADFIITPALLSQTRLLTLWDILTLSLSMDVVERSEFMRGLRLWEVKRLILLGVQKKIPKGEFIYQESQKGSSMFLMLKGAARFSMHDLNQDSCQVGFALPGDVFGHSALDGGEYYETAQATEDCELVEFSNAGLVRLQSLFPFIAAKIFRNLAFIINNDLVISRFKLSVQQ